MISDVLADAVDAIDRYLAIYWRFNDHLPPGRLELRGRIVAVRDQMDALRAELESPAEEAER